MLAGLDADDDDEAHRTRQLLVQSGLGVPTRLTMENLVMACWPICAQLLSRRWITLNRDQYSTQYTVTLPSSSARNDEKGQQIVGFGRPWNLEPGKNATKEEQGTRDQRILEEEGTLPRVGQRTDIHIHICIAIPPLTDGVLSVRR